MGVIFLCEHCGEERLSNPRLKVPQRFCGEKRCQQARKTAWQRHQMTSDADARDEHCRLHADWLAARPSYWREYRRKNPQKVERNRLLQRVRRQRTRQATPPPPGAVEDGRVAKMDAFVGDERPRFQGDGEYWLVPSVAKMDAFHVNIVIIPGEYPNASRVAKRDAIDQGGDGDVATGPGP